jgi:hypothetical protein
VIPRISRTGAASTGAILGSLEGDG